MQSSAAKVGDPADHVLLVGRDVDGRWLVQENHGLIEGLFVSREAALQFALCERLAFPGGRVVITGAPLRSILAH